MANGELAWPFLAPDTGLDHCLRILLSCFRARISDLEGAGVSSYDAVNVGGDAVPRLEAGDGPEGVGLHEGNVLASATSRDLGGGQAARGQSRGCDVGGGGWGVYGIRRVRHAFMGLWAD